MKINSSTTHITIFIALCFVCPHLFAQLKEGEMAIGGIHFDVGNSIVQTSDKELAVAGYTDTYGAGINDAYIVNLDSAGNLKWTKTIGGTNWDEGNSIIQTSDKGLAIAGWTDSYGSGNADVYVIKLDSAGNLKWTKTIGGTNVDAGNSIVQTSDKGLAIAGYTESFGAGNYDVYVVKLDSAGNLKWTKTIGGTNNDFGYSIVQTSDKGLAIAGWTDSYGAGNYDVYLIKLDSAGNLCSTTGSGGSVNSGGSVGSGGSVSSGGTASSGSLVSSGGTVTSICHVVLPVQLLYFNCSPFSQGIILNWATATETNNDHFTIERSGDGINYAPIATIKGAGNSSVTKYYSYTDEELLNGENYYRLSQTDFDGHSQSFEPTACEAKATAIQVYPNPSQGLFNIVLPSDNISVSTPINVGVTNLLGEQIYSITLKGQSQFNIDLSHDAAGMYFLNIVTSTRNYVNKIIVVH